MESADLQSALFNLRSALIYCSGPPLDDMPREPLQIWRQATNGFHCTTGLCHQRFRPASRLGDPHHEGIGALGERHVLPRGLSELVARRGDVENIIRNLERQAERIPEVGKRGQEV